MYWLGLQPGDVHLNISSPGWAKHAWSNFFAPWNAEATVFIFNYARFDAAGAAATCWTRCGVTTFCAPPTVWRMLIQADLPALHGRRCARWSAPASRSTPRSSSRSSEAWGLTIRDGYGQTETTAQIGNSPGPAGQAGLDGPAAARATRRAARPGDRRRRRDEGEICLDLSRAPGRPDGRATATTPSAPPRRCAAATTTPATSPAATRTATSPTSAAPTTCSRRRDYRISPFELESVLIEHAAVAEAAVVPSPDPMRLARAQGVRRAGRRLSSPTARPRRRSSRYCREHLAPYKRIRRHRVRRAAQDDLRQDPPGRAAQARGRRVHGDGGGAPDGVEYSDDDFPELRA